MLFLPSYIPSALRHWNSLDIQLRKTTTFNNFKCKLEFKVFEMCKLYSKSFDPGTRYVTQLRLGLNKLNTHLFALTIVPTTPHCPNPVSETLSHYLLECLVDVAERDGMLHSLEDVLPQEITDNIIKCTKYLIHRCDSLAHEANA